MIELKKVHCFFEQSGTFKNEFKKLGYDVEDYDIQNNFGETDNVIDLFGEIEKEYDNLTRQDKTRQDKTRQDKTRQYSQISTLVKTLFLLFFRAFILQAGPTHYTSLLNVLTIVVFLLWESLIKCLRGQITGTIFLR